MSRAGVWERTKRAIEFGRHMPFSKLARRVEVDARRMLRDRWPAASSRTPRNVSRTSEPPLPLFAPRSGVLAQTGDGHLSITFLGRTERLATPGLDWRAPGGGTEHQLWRMNLHYMEYLEEVADPLWMSLVADWIAANPPYRRGVWKDSWNSYALSLRVVVWMQELARRAGRLDAGLVRAIVESLIQQIEFLESNLETDLGGNHLIKNIKALAWASAFFEGGRAARWEKTAVKLLGAELPRQVLADGVHYERSPSYHAQVFADLLECRRALGHDPFAGALDDALRRMAQAAADLAHPDGKPALFNDAGLTMAYAPSECLDAYEQLFGRRPAARGVFALDSADYFGLRTPQSYFVADCGRIAPDDLPAHGHGDALSFEWSLAGDRIIVDQGVFEYNAGARRQASRAAANHNTLCFDGSDQADFFGAFRCGRRPNVNVRTFESRPDGFVLEGSHDGFRYLPGAPAHIRRFEVAPGGIVIRDRIEGQSDRGAWISFLMHPLAEVEASNMTASIRRGATLVRMRSTGPVAIENAVWWPDMGHELQTRRLRVRLAPGVREAVTVFEAANIGGASPEIV